MFLKESNNISVNWKYKESSAKGFKYKFYILIVGKRKFTIARTTFSQSLRISLIFTYMYINLFHRTGALWNPSRFTMNSSVTIRIISISFIRNRRASRKNYTTKLQRDQTGILPFVQYLILVSFFHHSKYVHTSSQNSLAYIVAFGIAHISSKWRKNRDVCDKLESHGILCTRVELLARTFLTNF